MRRLIGAVFAVLIGCNGADDEAQPLTCEILSDPGNCWAEAAAEAATCVPSPDEEIGVLEPDRASCTYTVGSRVVFDEALPLDVMDLERLALTLEKDGAKCGRFVDTFMNRMELEAGPYGAVSQLFSSERFELRCNDGRRYTSDFDLLFTCDPWTAPTDGFDVTPDSFLFMISSVATPGEMIRCAP